jgi:hypothetical protein
MVPTSTLEFTGLNSSDFSIMVDALGKIPIQGSPLTPYGVFGFGMNFLSASDGVIKYQGVEQPNLGIKGDSSTKFGLNFGAGAEFAVSPMVKLFLEFKYLLVFTSGESTGLLPLMVGATFGG